MKLSKTELDLLKKAYETSIDGQNNYHPEFEDALADFEERFALIPTDYRYLLRTFGGCHFVDPWIFTLKQLLVEYPAFVENYSEEEIDISEHCFPIGGLGDGSLVCIIKETNEIAVLPHDVYVETIDNLEIIAYNFKEFILDLAQQGIDLCKKM